MSFSFYDVEKKLWLVFKKMLNMKTTTLSNYLEKTAKIGCNTWLYWFVLIKFVMYSDLNLKKPSTRNGLCSRIDTRIDTNGLEQLQTSNSTELFSELFT